MNENVKMFIKKVNKDESLKKEFSEISDKLKVETDRENAITTHILPFAKKAGYDFTVEDFAIDGELSEEELKAVSGGGGCACLGSGGGGGKDSNNKKTYGCACVYYGQGGDGSTMDDFNCFCMSPGCGNDEGFQIDE